MIGKKEGGRERERERGKEGGRERGKERGRERERERGRERGREGRFEVVFRNMWRRASTGGADDFLSLSSLFPSLSFFASLSFSSLSPSPFLPLSTIAGTWAIPILRNFYFNFFFLNLRVCVFSRSLLL
jgi:hypothetical protein